MIFLFDALQSPKHLFRCVFIFDIIGFGPHDFINTLFLSINRDPLRSVNGPGTPLTLRSGAGEEDDDPLERTSAIGR